MDKHLEVFVLPEVEVGGLVDGASVAVTEVLHRDLQRLFVDAGGLRHSDGPFLLDAGRDDIRHGLALAVLVDADGRDVHLGFVGRVVRLVFAWSLDVLRVGSPFAFHKVKRGEAQHDGALKSAEEHSHETDGGVVVDVADNSVGLPDGDAELIPSHASDLAIRQGDACGIEHVRDVIVTYDHLVRVEFNHVLVVTLGFAEGVVAVDVFDVGHDGIAGRVTLGHLCVRGRVAFRSVVLLVAFKDALVNLIARVVPFA